MSVDLVKRLRESGSRSEIEIHEDREEAADRIEELESALRESALQELSALGQATEAYQAQLAAEARIEELEAKLAKAVEALQSITFECVGDSARCGSRAALAELKGEPK